MEQARFEISEENKSVIQSEFARSMKELAEGFTLVDENLVKKTKETYRNEVFEYQFITFNYTDVLTRIVNCCKKSNIDVGTHINTSGGRIADKIGDILHIHGTVLSEPILAVNDASQINNDFLRSESLFLSTFIKRQINDFMGQQRTERAQDIISKSQIKNDFLEKGKGKHSEDEIRKIWGQVIVMFNSKIFSFSKIN